MQGLVEYTVSYAHLSLASKVVKGDHALSSRQASCASLSVGWLALFVCCIGFFGIPSGCKDYFLLGEIVPLGTSDFKSFHCLLGMS